MAGHLGSFGRALAASARRRRLSDEGAFDEAADRLGTREPWFLVSDPAIKDLHKPRLNADANEFALTGRGRASFFLCYHGLTPHQNRVITK
jgi:hypothetical protein